MRGDSSKEHRRIFGEAQEGVKFFCAEIEVLSGVPMMNLHEEKDLIRENVQLRQALSFAKEHIEELSSELLLFHYLFDDEVKEVRLGRLESARREWG